MQGWPAAWQAQTGRGGGACPGSPMAQKRFSFGAAPWARGSLWWTHRQPVCRAMPLCVRVTLSGAGSAGETCWGPERYGPGPAAWSSGLRSGTFTAVREGVAMTQQWGQGSVFPRERVFRGRSEVRVSALISFIRTGACGLVFPSQAGAFKIRVVLGCFLNLQE